MVSVSDEMRRLLLLFPHQFWGGSPEKSVVLDRIASGRTLRNENRAHRCFFDRDFECHYRSTATLSGTFPQNFFLAYFIHPYP